MPCRFRRNSGRGGNVIFSFLRDQKSIGGTSVFRMDTSLELLYWTTGYNVPDGAAADNPGITVVKNAPPGFDAVTLTCPCPIRRNPHDSKSRPDEVR
jgi:hypothetical protein